MNETRIPREPPDDAEARCEALIEEINKILRCPESWRKSDIISRLNYAVEKAQS